MNTPSKVKRAGVARGEKIYSSLASHIQGFIARGVPAENGCLIYPTSRRYPSMRYEGQMKNFGQWVLVARGINAHRIVARHTCDTSRCVNLEHIVAGTQRENVYDLVKRGTPNGILQGKGRNRKLSQEQVSEIRQLHATGTYSYKQLAQLFQVPRGSISWYINNYPLLAC
jgi:transposase